MYNKKHMSKVDNRKKYKHNIDLVKYSEDGLKKRCKGCVEEFEKLQSSGYCNDCWSFYFREKRKGKTSVNEIFKDFQYKWELLKEKYKNVKKCNTCLIIKGKEKFYPDKKSVHGFQNKCICCIRGYNLKNGYVKERDRSYQNYRYQNDIQYKIKVTLRNRFYSAIIKGHKIKSVLKLLGCSIEECKQYIEQQFKEEMEWSNHGKYWELDHIRPCASFDLTKIEEQEKCFHFSNLQPLTVFENRSKGDKYEI
jgi:hypothetical protein